MNNDFRLECINRALSMSDDHCKVISVTEVVIDGIIKINVVTGGLMVTSEMIKSIVSVGSSLPSRL